MAGAVGAGSWDRIDVGAWPGAGWSVGSYRVLRATPGSGAAGAEAERLAWLGPQISCPEVVAFDGDWLVLTAPAGHPADRPERQPRPDDVPVAVGEALRRLHQLPVAGCPFDRTGPAVLAEIEAGLTAGRFRPERLPAPYDRYQPDALLAMARQQWSEPAPSDLVVAHGQPTLASLFLDQGQLAALTGVFRLGRGDRHLDLAVAYRSLHRAFGPDAVYGLIEGYGRDPDLVRLDHCVLLDVLLDAVAPAAGDSGARAPASRISGVEESAVGEPGRR